MVITGLSELSGFWGIMPIWPPRTLRMADGDRRRRSRPSKMISPPVILPGEGTIRITAWADTLLPDPLSPTTPTRSPARTWRLKPLYGVDGAALQPERDVQVADLEQGGPGQPSPPPAPASPGRASVCS